MPMNKYGLHGKLKAKDGNADQLADILIKASALVSTAKGCQLYVVSRDTTDKHAVWVTEIWDSKEDHDNSLKVEGVKRINFSGDANPRRYAGKRTRTRNTGRNRYKVSPLPYER